MRRFSRTTQFKKDLDKLQKQGKDLKRIRKVIEILIEGKELNAKYKDHPLRGSWNGSRDCHVEPDCVLIYTVENDHVRFERIGSHSELFR